MSTRTFTAVHLNLAGVRLDAPSGHRQSQTHPPKRPGSARINAVEALEEMRVMFFRNAGSAVFYLDDPRAVIAECTHGDFARSRSVPDGVVEDVGDRYAKYRGVHFGRPGGTRE